MVNKNEPVKESIIDQYIAKSKASLDKAIHYKIIDIKAATMLVFPDDALNLSLFHELLPIMLTAATGKFSAKEATRNTALLSIVFSNFNDAISYLKRYEQEYEGGQLIHDACLIALPSTDKWNAPVWKALIQKHINKPKIFKLFQNAIAIEEYLEENRKALEEENSKKIEARFVLSYGQKYDALQNIKIKETQIKATQKEFEDYLKGQLGFPNRGKPTAEQNAALKQRIKTPSDDDKKQREKLIKQYLEKASAPYKDIDVSSKEAFIKAMLEKNKIQIESFKANENKAIFAKETTYEQLTTYLSLARYKNYHKNVAAAELFSDLGIPEAGFNEYLSMVPKDNTTHIPEVHIEGEVLGHKGYLLKKLNPSDPRAAVLGKLTSCCQSVEDYGDDCVKHGITNERGGFYVLCHIDPKTKKEQIVAQCWAWRGLNNSLVFDSIESNINFRKTEGSAKLITAFYVHLADKLVQEHEVENVLVGFGGATPASLKIIPAPDMYTDSFSGYADSTAQGFLAIKGAFLCPVFLTAKPQNPPPVLTKTAQNRLCYLIYMININHKLYESCGLTNEAFQAWKSIWNGSIFTRINSGDKKIVLEAFEDYKRCVGIDDKTTMHVLDDDYLSSYIQNREAFLRIILANGENHFLISSTTGINSILMLIDSDRRIDFIKEMIGYETISSLIGSANDVLPLLDCIPGDSVFEFFKEAVDVTALQANSSIDDLLPLINHIPLEIRLEFIKVLFGAEGINSLMHSTDEFTQLLGSLPEQKRIAFFKEVAGNTLFISTLHTMDDLTSLLKLLPAEYRSKFIKDIIGNEKAQSLITCEDDITSLLNCIPHDQTIVFFKEVVRNPKFLATIHTMDELTPLLIKMTDNNLGSATGQSSTSSIAGLTSLFNKFLGYSRIEFVKEIVGVEKLLSMDCTQADFLLLLRNLSINHDEFEFIEELLRNTKVQSRINSAAYLIDILKEFHKTNHLRIITEVLGKTKFQSLVTSFDDLARLLNFHNDHLHELDFFNEVLGGDAPKPQLLINSLADLQFLLRTMLRQRKFEFLKGVFGSAKHLSLINSMYDADSILATVNLSTKSTGSGAESELIEKLKTAATQKHQEILERIHFDQHLEIFEEKALQMKEKSITDPKYIVAAEKAAVLCEQLNEAKKTFLNDSEHHVKELQEIFKNTCVNHVKEARPVWEQHREWIGVLAQFLADLINWFSPRLASKLGFFGKTDSAVKLEQLEKDLTTLTNK